ncbi:four helix bundle protein [Patescibacteria group bacterium]|nr:four helix bundle protein [Patescibacteria group bacterium]MBU1895451.1 four helix bundle protein [Patescibacteria group bacterium]
MEEIEKFRKLRVWQEARLLVREIYEITATFSQNEQYGLVSQVRRASISIIANIAEGTKRQTAKDRKHFYVMADTSLEEVKCYVIIGFDLKFITIDQGKQLTTRARDVGRMLNGLIKKQN